MSLKHNLWRIMQKLIDEAPYEVFHPESQLSDALLFYHSVLP